ncbi:hypothetical protein B0H14DRAFT_3509043 [Mycena olivaceomarginata]|nr:hypothetical protein B0H14DRAFT_3509043 [Mycena olivaceomarginata]
MVCKRLSGKRGGGAFEAGRRGNACEYNTKGAALVQHAARLSSTSSAFTTRARRRAEQTQQQDEPTARRTLGAGQTSCRPAPFPGLDFMSVRPRECLLDIPKALVWLHHSRPFVIRPGHSVVLRRRRLALYRRTMKSVRSKKNQNVSRRNATASTSMLATNLPTYKITYHTGQPLPPVASAADLPPTDSSVPQSEERYLANVTVARPRQCRPCTREEPGAVPAYETTAPCDEKGAKKRQTVAHMDELKAQQAVFLDTMLSLHYSSQLHTPCSCSVDRHVRTVACTECLQAELLCPQCWLHKHRTMPTHWALIWDAKGKFFQKHDFCRVMKNASIALGHYGERCPEADLARTFTLVDTNGIHATAIKFCRCKTVDGERGAPAFQQLCARVYSRGASKIRKQAIHWVCSSIIARSVIRGRVPRTTSYTFCSGWQTPSLRGAVPDIYANFLAITPVPSTSQRHHAAGHAHRDDVPLPGEADRPYPNRAIGYLEQHVLQCDDGSDTALTDGNMHFPPQKEYEQIAKEYVIAKEDKEVPCKAHIGSIRHQGHAKYGNVAISGVVGTACDHAVVLAFVDMLVGEAFALGTYAQLVSYNSYCSFVVNQLKRATVLFPKDSWFHEMLEEVEGQIPADHINGHGPDCQCVWQAVYFACRAHFHGETAEMIWGFLNPLGASTRQMTGGARHDTINFVIDAWNTRKVLRQAELLAGERADALRLFELHMAVLEDLSRQHSTEVGGWSRLSRKVSKSDDGQLASVYQHQSTKVLTIENVLASLLAEEQEQRQRLPRAAGSEPTTSLAQWVRDGMDIERQQVLVIVFLQNQPPASLAGNVEHYHQKSASVRYNPRLTLSALDVNEPELTAIQLPSYRMKHGQRTTTDATDSDSQLRQAEIKLRCSEADSGILAVRAASLALSAIRKARELDYRGQVGITRSQRNIQNAELMKFFEMDMYNKARAALTHLGHMPKDATEPYPPLTLRDTRRKETHLHRMQGDSRLFDGTAWYLQSGGTVHSGGFASSLSPVKRRDEDEGQPQFMTGTQTLKRAGGVVKSPRAPKRLKDIIPDDVAVDCPVSSGAEDSDLDMSPSEPGKLGRARGERKKKKGGEGKKKRGDGWIWLESVSRGVTGEGNWPSTSEKVIAFSGSRAEAEMYRWLEAYERKHAELFRVIARFRRDSEVWTGRADRDEMENGGLTGAGAFARMQAAMYQRLQHNAEVHFRSPESGAHHDWVTATSFDELVAKVDSWRDGVFSWMDGMGIYRAYKDF